MSTAEQFYTRHYNGGLSAGGMPLPEYEAEMMGPGKRYRLPVDHFAAHPPDGKVLVEVGCGGGQMLTLFGRRFRFASLIGIDVALIDAERTTDGVTTRKGDLDRRWPLEDGSVDYLMAMMVIEHLYDPFHAFREVARTLTQGGTAFVNLPLVTGLRNRLRLAAGLLPVTSDGYEVWFANQEWDGNHLHYFSLASIRRLARCVGLRVAEVRGVGRMAGLKTALPGLLAGEVTFSLVHA
jgi:SAM-dependent methyltransferase